MIRNTNIPSQPPAIGSFTYDSSIAEQQTSNNLRETSDQLNIISEIMNAGQNKYINSKGLPILNATTERIWFSRSVAFIFALGRIYDEDDDKKMKAIMNYFNDESPQSYLENHYRVESYSSPLIQAIEKKLRIGNGNYHVFMTPVVYADDSIISSAPEPQFKRKGIVDKYTSWDSIVDYMKDMIVRYGIVVELDRPHDQASHEIGSAGLPENAPHPSRYDEATKFNYNSLNSNIEHMSTIDQTLKVKEELVNDFNQRQRKAKMDRKGETTGSTNNSKRKSLYSQMYSDDAGTMNYDTIMGDMKGVALRLDDRSMPPSVKVDEYQLYDDAYDDVHNKNIMHDANETRQNIPRFMQFATRATSNGNRRVNTNVDSLGLRTTNQFTHDHQGYNA